jgi:WD40 repeat protein
LLSLTWAGLAPADRASFAWRLPLFDHLVGDSVESVGFSSDGRIILFNDRRTLNVWEVATGRELHTWDLFDPVGAVAFSRDGRYALYANIVPLIETMRDRSGPIIKLMEIGTGKELRTLKGQSTLFPLLFAIALAPDRRTALSAGSAVKLWDIAAGKEVRTFTESSGDLNFMSVAYSPDGRTALSGGTDNILKLWDLGQ